MKKAVLYARVSSELQKKERTIESQITELKSQIKDAGAVLVKEYIDDGYSGARLDRPALEELRRDVKTPLFDSIYFLNTDRIARDVTYQIIIISEILKQRKQLIINGRDYIENPENKFTLTVLGAVAELEKAKIIERFTRGKQHKLRQGSVPTQGSRMYGYDYIRKTSTALGNLVVNHREAAVVRKVFEMYAGGNIGLSRISRYLEERQAFRKTGAKPWHTQMVKNILKHHAYVGIKYFNTQHEVRQYANPLFGTGQTTRKVIMRPREEWIGIQVPPIVSKELFDKVQARLDWNSRHYRNPKRVQLLSSLIECGLCGRSCFGYQRRYKYRRRAKPAGTGYKRAYLCSGKHEFPMHFARAGMARCPNPEIASQLLEDSVFAIIRDTMTDPFKLRARLEYASKDERAVERQIEAQLKAIDSRSERLGHEKKRMLDLYAVGDLDRDVYARRCLRYDHQISQAEAKRDELVNRIPILRNPQLIDLSVRQYVEAVRARLENAIDFDTKRQFLLDHLDRVVYANDRLALYGSVLVNFKSREVHGQPSDRSKIRFSIESTLSRKPQVSSRSHRAPQGGE
jgi:DNA invertase Pin-like site-specific DNA recombinase